MKITIKQLIDLLSKEDLDTIIDFDINPCGYCIGGFMKELEKEYVKYKVTIQNDSNEVNSVSTFRKR